MAKFTINTGSSPNDGTGDNLRTGATYINNNFNEIYNAIGNGTVLTAYLDLADDTSSTLRKNIGETLTFEGGLGIDTVITGGKVQIKVNNSVLTTTATATLTNKTLSLTNNTISGTLTEFNTALTGTNFASTDQSETLTNKSMSGADNTFTAIPNTGLSNPGITIRDNTSTTDFVNLGETLSILGTGSVSSSVTGNTVTLNVSNLTNSDLSGSAGITNANLANSTVTIGNTAVALGSNISSAGNFNLTGTSSVSGSGTIDTTGSGSKVRGNFANQASFPTATSYSGLFALDETQLKPFVATQSGYINILTENDSVSRHADVFTTGIQNGYILKWVSANGRFEAQAESGGSVALNDLTDVVNSSPTAGMSLVYNGTNWVQATTPVSQLLVTANGSSAYLFTGAGFPSTSGDNPALHLKKGNTYYFINNSGGSHPFRIQSTTGTGGTAYNTGVTNNGASSGAIIFHVSMDTPATLYYQCTNHGSMQGTINIT
jgi:hypothetical protein